MLKKPDAELLELLGRRAYEKVNLRPSKEQVAAVLRDSPRSNCRGAGSWHTETQTRSTSQLPETGSPGRPTQSDSGESNTM